MPRTAKTRATSDERRATHPPFIEVVNWRAAQPRMTGRNNPWMKLYTSLLDNEAFEGLDDSSRMLVIGLWLYAARSGEHVFPADPRWLWKRIPMLHAKPDLEPLLNAADARGRPAPFIRYCEAQEAEEGPQRAQRKVKSQQSKVKKAAAGRRTAAAAEAERSDGQTVGRSDHASTKRSAEQSREEKRVEESREEEKRAEQSPRVYGNPTQVMNQRVSLRSGQKREESKPEHRTAQQSPADQRPAAAQHSGAEKPAQSERPNDPEARPAHGATGPGPARPAFLKHDPHPLGRIPIWWSDPACTAFSYAIFEALGLRDPDSSTGKSERGTFAAWLFEARATLPATQWGDLEQWAIGKAREIRKYHKAARSPGAVWLSIMHKSLPKRAGPASAQA